MSFKGWRIGGNVWSGALLLALGMGFAACSSTEQPTGPSGLAATGVSGGVSSPQAGTVRYYGATLATTSSAAGTTGTYTLVLTNCNGTGTCGSAVTSAHQNIGSGTVTIPAGFTPNGGTLSVAASNGKLWSASLSAGVITLQANGGTNKLEPGESVTVTIDAVAPCQGANYAWATHAYQDTPLATTTPYTLAGPAASVTITGTCQLGCTLGQGYWKTHSAAWPVTTLTLGTVSYSQSQLLSILNQPVVGNGLINLSYQLIAAKLNIAAGADGSSIAASIAAADAIIGSLVVPPVGTDSVSTASTSALVTALENYNSGITGPGACVTN